MHTSEYIYEWEYLGADQKTAGAGKTHKGEAFCWSLNGGSRGFSSLTSPAGRSSTLLCRFRAGGQGSIHMTSPLGGSLRSARSLQQWAQNQSKGPWARLGEMKKHLEETCCVRRAVLHSYKVQTRSAGPVAAALRFRGWAGLQVYGKRQKTTRRASMQHNCKHNFVTSPSCSGGGGGRSAAAALAARSLRFLGSSCAIDPATVLQLQQALYIFFESISVGISCCGASEPWK